MKHTTALILGAVAGAAAAVFLPRGLDDHRPAEPLDVDLDDVRAVVATDGSLAPWALGTLGAGSGALLARAMAGPRRRDAVGAAIIGLLTAALRRVGVVVGGHGVTVTCGIPALRGQIPYRVIRSARAVTVTAAEFGGLGVRWSPERGAGLILRSGPALTLDLDRGPLTISVDDPTDAAALITRHLEHARR